jgi:hypothetical protein
MPEGSLRAAIPGERARDRACDRTGVIVGIERDRTSRSLLPFGFRAAAFSFHAFLPLPCCIAELIEIVFIGCDKGTLDAVARNAEIPASRLSSHPVDKRDAEALRLHGLNVAHVAAQRRRVRLERQGYPPAGLEEWFALRVR